MKINLIYSGIHGPNGADYVAHYCKNAFADMGHEVVEVGTFGGHSGANLPFDPTADYALCILGYAVPAELLAKIKIHMPVVLWTHNDEMPMHICNSKRLVGECDLYCSYTRYLLDDYFGKITNTLYLPIGADPNIFRPLEGLSYEYDVSMVGCGHGERVRIVNELMRRMPHLRWFTNWNLALPYEDLNRVHNTTKVVIAPFMDCDQGVLNPAFGCPCRTFDVPATKAFQIQLERAGLWDVYTREEVVTLPTKDIDKWQEAILYYLEHEEERNAYRERAYKRTVETNLYKHRMQAIIDKLMELGKLK